MGVFHVFKIVRMVPNRAKHHIYDEPLMSFLCLKSIPTQMDSMLQSDLSLRKFEGILHKYKIKVPHLWSPCQTYMENHIPLK